MKQGTGMMKWSNGEIYDGEWREDQMDGYGQYTNSQGDSKRVKFRRGVIDLNA